MLIKFYLVFGFSFSCFCKILTYGQLVLDSKTHLSADMYLPQNRLYIKHPCTMHREKRKNGFFSHSGRRCSKTVLEITNL